MKDYAPLKQRIPSRSTLTDQKVLDWPRLWDV